MVFLFNGAGDSLAPQKLVRLWIQYGSFFLPSAWLPACIYHAFVWYAVHAVGWGHGGENIDAAVDVFLP